MIRSDATAETRTPAHATGIHHILTTVVASMSLLAMSGCGSGQAQDRTTGQSQERVEPSASAWPQSGFSPGSSEESGPGMTILETHTSASRTSEATSIDTGPQNPAVTTGAIALEQQPAARVHADGVIQSATTVEPVQVAPSVAWPPLSDPIGLRQRLTTIAWIQERIGALPPDATDEQILAAYADAIGLDAGTQEIQHEPQQVGVLQRQSGGDPSTAYGSGEPPAVTATTESPAEAMLHGPAQTASAPIDHAASNAIPVIPTIDNRKEWAENYGIAPVATRGNLSVTIYTMRDDPDHYYLMVEAKPGAAAANLIIGHGYFGTITPKMSGSVHKVPCQSGVVVQSPDISLAGL